MHIYDVHWHPKVKIKKLGSFKKVKRARQITIGTHTGTHVDAPDILYQRNRKYFLKLSVEAMIFDFSKFPLKKYK